MPQVPAVNAGNAGYLGAQIKPESESTADDA
jgi:hypothetical protein